MPNTLRFFRTPGEQFQLPLEQAFHEEIISAEEQIQLQASLRMSSKYLIEYKGYFSRTYLVLSLQESGMQIQPLSSDREEKDGGVTRIDWSSIASVQASDRNSREFTLSTAPQSSTQSGGKRNSTTVKSVPLANAQHTVYQCNERNRLLTEINHKLHDINSGCQPLIQEPALYTSDIFADQDSPSKLVSVRVHPTIIQITLIPRKSSKKFIDKQITEEQKADTKKNGQSDPQTEPKEVGYIDHESLNALIQRTRLLSTQFRGRNAIGPSPQGVTSEMDPIMMGGTSNAEQYKYTDSHLTSFISSQYIYMSEIEKLYRSNDLLIVVSNNQSYELLQFSNEDTAKSVMDTILRVYTSSYKQNLPFEINKGVEDIASQFKREGPLVFSRDVQSINWDGSLLKTRIDVDEDSVYEIDLKSERIRRKFKLLDLQFVRVSERHAPLFNLILLFRKETEMCIMVNSSYDRDRLLSAILTLRGLLIPVQGYLENVNLLMNSHSLDYSQRIIGHDPNQIIEQSAAHILEYETFLIKKICENINFKDSLKINYIIEEILLNGSYGQLIKIDQGQIRIILKEIKLTLEEYISYEGKPGTQESDHRSVGDIGSSAKQALFSKSLLQQSDEQAERIRGIDIQEKIVKYLNLLAKLLNCKPVFNEMSEHQDLLCLLVELLGSSRNPYIKLLASNALKSAVQHHSGLESKSQLAHKKLIIQGKPKSSTDGNRFPQFERQQGQGLFQVVKELLLQFEAINDPLTHSIDTLKPCSITIYSIGNLLRSILHTRRGTTSREELKVFADIMIDDDERYKKVQYEEDKSQVQTPRRSLINSLDDPLQNKPLFHLLEKFTMLGQNFFDIQLFFSLILHETLWYLRRYESEKQLGLLQSYALTFSVQFVWHLLQLQQKTSGYETSSYIIKEQKKLSTHILSKFLFQSDQHLALLLRCYPKVLLEKVETHIDVVKSKTWGDSEWEEFFMKVTEQNFTQKATEQWDDETRRELKVKLQEEISAFQDAKRIHMKIINGQKHGSPDSGERQLILPNHEFSRDKRVVTRYSNLKWNFMEFGVRYQCLKGKHLVWKYYLTKLLVEKNLDELQRPYFSLEVEKPIQFWQELKTRFMSSFDQEEQLILLKSMSVLYRTHFLQLRELTSISYFLRLFGQPLYQHCHFVLLQLIHVALAIEDKKLSVKNMKKFIKYGGLQILLDQMKLSLVEGPYLGNISNVNALPLNNTTTNFTNSNTNSRYFTRNSISICLGILSLKIWDILFREMNAIDNIPLPSNREFLLKQHSLALLTQVLTLENSDFTRELTIFILNHMDNHYFFYRLKNAGMIELLILSLSTVNGSRALKILQRFQEVSFDYNANNLKLGLFSANDLKVLQDDKESFQKNFSLHPGQQSKAQGRDASQSDPLITSQNPNEVGSTKKTVLAESIFLRFLPVPLIKYFYEKDQEEFLHVYKLEFFESPILIWNSSLRVILENTIKAHFISMLQEGVCQTDSFLGITDKKLMSIVRYPEIESEVRCGRYYLRVWVDQKKKQKQGEESEQQVPFFEIPTEEEDEFHKNLQAELKHSIYEEQFNEQGKTRSLQTNTDYLKRFIILFKACLLALQRFNKKRLFSLDEVKRILIDTCKNQPVYNDTIKQIVYIGMKIIYEVIKTSQDLKEILTKIGVEIIAEVFNLILRRSFSKFEGFDQERIDVDRIETKTIILCIQCFNMIMNSDVQAFTDFPHSQRLSLFKQISRLMDISFKLLPMFVDEELTNDHIITRGDIADQIVQPKSAFFDPVYQQAEVSRRSSVKKVHQKQMQRKKSLSIHQQQSSQSASKAKRIISDDQQLGKRMHQKTEGIDYKQPLLLIIEQSADKYSIELICEMMRCIAELSKQLTKNPVLHPEIIESGIAWKTLKSIYFQLKEEVDNYKDLKVSLRLSSVTLKNMISFANQLTNQGAETFALKSLTKESEKEKMTNFWNCIKAIFAKKIRDTLLSQFVIKNNELNFPNHFNPKNFLQQFSVKAEASSKLVWDDETRSELRDILDAQISSLELSLDDSQSSHLQFFDHLISFEYSVNRRELKVEDIFVRHFNKPNDRFRPPDVDIFAYKIIEKLREYINGRYLADLSTEESSNCQELVVAFKNLLQREEAYIISNQDVFRNYLDTFCSILRIEDPSFAKEQEMQTLSALSNVVLDIITIFALRGGIYISYLTSHDEFIKLLIRALYGFEKELIHTNRIILVLQIMLSSKELDVETFLIRQGLVFFILNQIFERKERNINERVEFVRILLHEANRSEKIFGCFIPNKFFVEFFSLHRELIMGPLIHPNQLLQNPKNPLAILQVTSSGSDMVSLAREKIKDFLKNQFDAVRFENVFVIWNEELRRKSHERVKYNCEQIVRSYDDSGYHVKWDLGKLENPFLENEIKVKDVIVRIYNKNPSVYIKEKLNTFILEICFELQKVALEIVRLRQTNDDDRSHSHQMSQYKIKKFTVPFQKSNLLLTALLLSIEQLLFNEYNPNRLLASKKDMNTDTQPNLQSQKTLNGQDVKFYKQIIEKITDQTQLDQEVFQIIGFWLQQQVFMTQIEHMTEAIKITFLQIVYLLLDVGDAIKVMLENQTLIQFINESINGIFENRHPTAVEEFMILLIVYKVLTKESQIVPVLAATLYESTSANSKMDQSSAVGGSQNLNSSQTSNGSVSGGPQSTIEILLKILGLRKGQSHAQLIEMIIQLMARDLQYRESVVSSIKQIQAKSPQFKIDMKILETRHDKYEEMIRRMWRPRGKPLSSVDGRSQYEAEGCQKIEDKKGETHMDKLRLPLLSKKSIHCIAKEDLLYQEDENKGLSEMRSSTRNSDRIRLGSDSSQKQNQLGYEPMLTGIQQSIQNSAFDNQAKQNNYEEDGQYQEGVWRQ